MTRRLILAFIIFSLIGIGLVQAQASGGQICIQAYEDRNGNALDDAGEPRIQRGISASLLDGNGVIAQTALMQNSLNAARGTLCFQRLPAGQYTVRVASADYTFTTVTEFLTAITDTGVQQFSVGGELIVSTVPVADSGGDLQLSAAERQNLVTRLVFAMLGAGIVIGAMAIVGAFIYLIFLRQPAEQVRYATGAYPAVQSPTSTGSMQPVISPEDTNPPRRTVPTPPSAMQPVQYEDDDDTNHPRRPAEQADDDFQFSDDEPDFLRPED